MQDACSLMPFPTIGDSQWQREAINRAIDMYGSGPRGANAIIVARSHPFAIQTLEQAPVALLALSSGRREKIVAKTRESFGTGVSLRDLLKGAGIALQFRRLRPKAFQPYHHPVLQLLSAALGPSTLAQVIPEELESQRSWLEALHDWVTRMERGNQPRDMHLGWAAAALGRSGAAHQWYEVADLALHLGTRFNTRWSWAKAYEEAERWHRELNKRKNDRDFFKSHGMLFEALIDYAPLPAQAEILDVNFIALQSGAALFEDGRAMRHCVASYAGPVIAGKSRIYSIRRGEKRLATLEVGQEKKKWRMLQIKGPCNAEPRPEIVSTARIFIKTCNSHRAGDAASEGGLIASPAAGP